MYRSELYAVLGKCLNVYEAGRSYKEELKEIASHFPCCPVNRECSWKKTHREKKKKKRKKRSRVNSVNDRYARSPLDETHLDTVRELM